MSEDYIPFAGVESVIDAEAVLYEVEPKLNRLLGEFKPRGYSMLQFPYLNEDSELAIVSVAASGLHDLTTHYSVVSDKSDRYRLIVSRTPGESDDTKSLQIRLQTWHERAEVYVDAEEKDIIRAGRLLDQLDVEKVRSQTIKLEEERKAHRGKWAGRVLGNRWLGPR
jgi:hypothetical protein